MTSRVLFLMVPLAVAACRPAEPMKPAPIGPFEGVQDIGSTGLAGTTVLGQDPDVVELTGAGANMWGTEDAFRFAWKKVGGDFVLRARGSFPEAGGHEHRKFGVLLRTGLGADDATAYAAAHGDGLAALQYRLEAGGETAEIRVDGFESGMHAPDVVQIERSGSTVTASFARFGEPLRSVRVDDFPAGDTLYVGLFVCSHDATRLETARFSQVRFVKPAEPGFTPYEDFLGSRLEILDVSSGDRAIVLTDPGSIQAPNWTPDGAALIFNRDGLLWRFDLAKGETSRIDTDFATANNNDHVLSFDGSMLAISHHAEDADGQSIVYTVPVKGGVPRRVTELGPSYLHGWSPDGKHLVYTALRGGDYDVYRIAVDGGAETRLTDTPGLDDGPEYTPDGEWIWFNSVRSGTMQLWRMRATGADAQRMTESATNDWFPHISPDGRWVAYLAYGPDVAPSEHPFYRHVTLNLVPADGSAAPRVIAYVYGGQGTINVPSWSPDSKRLAFVSNSGEF